MRMEPLPGDAGLQLGGSRDSTYVRKEVVHTNDWDDVARPAAVPT